MKIEVHIRNGRTAFRFAKRSDLTRLLGMKPDGDHPGIMGEIRHNVDDDFIPWKIRHISASSISYVIELPK